MHASGMALIVAVACVAAPLVAAVQQEDLVKFFTASSGLSMSSSDASKLAAQERASLTACGITVPYLQKLRDTMYKVSGMDFPIRTIQEKIFTAAYQHADPTDLDALYGALYSTSKVDLSKQAAQDAALRLAMLHAEPYLVGPIYEVLYSTSKVDLPKAKAQSKTVDLVLAGADAGTLDGTYTKNKGQGTDTALAIATRAAVEANLDGLDERYAKNGESYTAKGFADYYKDTWFTEWASAPKQKRTATDGIDYLASEFKAFFGASWADKWNAAPVATLSRIAPDGKTYTLAEFKDYYKDTWQDVWFKSYEILDLCAGLNQASCKGVAKCQWKFNGDWTTSCVPAPLSGITSSELVV